MDKQLQEELKIRRWIRDVLFEEIYRQDNDLMVEQLLNEYFSIPPDDLIATFITPFTDVLKVAAVGGKEILSAARLSFDVLTSIRPSTIDKAKDRYKKRSETLSKEWGEVMKSTDQALSGDAQLFAFMLNPAGYMGAKLAQTAAGAPGGVAQYMEDSGWGIPIVGNILGVDQDKSGAKASEKEKDAQTPLLSKLGRFFFMAHAEPDGPLLVEAEEEDKGEKGEKEKKPGGSDPADVQKYFEKMGLDSKLKQDAADLIEAKKEQVDGLMKIFTAQVELLDKIYAAQDLKALAGALTGAKQAGVDLGGSGLGDFEQQVNSQVSEILQGEETRAEFVKNYLEKSGAAPKEGEPAPEVPDEKLKPEVEKVIFMNATQGMQQEIYSGVQKMKEQIKNEIMDGVPEKEDQALIKQSEEGKTYLSMIEDAVKKIDAV